VLDFQVTNCSADRTQTLSTSLVGTAVTVRSVDPYVVDTCAGLPFAAPQITLAPRASRKISVQPRYPFCGRAQWGVDGYDINYDVTTSDAAGGPVLATTTSSVLRRGGV
jgi:hypothetical protein